MKIRVREMYYPDEGPEESDLAEQVELDVSKTVAKNVAALRATVLEKCPQAVVTAGDVQVEDVRYFGGRHGSSLTALVRCPVSVEIPGNDKELEEAVDYAVAELEPIDDSHGYLQGLEWMPSQDGGLAYTLEGGYKKES